MKKTALVLLMATNLFLAFWLINSVRSEVSYRNDIRKRKSRIIEKLKFIRQLQVVYKSQKGHYASDWHDLTTFGTTGFIYTIAFKEIPILNSSGLVSEVDFKIDTIGKASVYDSLFAKVSFEPSALNTIPGYETDNFVLKTDTTVVGGVNLEVIKVSCPVLVNKRNSFKFGSLESPTLAGNWK